MYGVGHGVPDAHVWLCWQQGHAVLLLLKTDVSTIKLGSVAAHHP